MLKLNSQKEWEREDGGGKEHGKMEELGDCLAGKMLITQA